MSKNLSSIGNETPIVNGQEETNKKKSTRGIRTTTETNFLLTNKFDKKDYSHITKKVKVVGFVSDKLHYTEDMSIFKKYDANRGVLSAGVKKILNSVEKSGKWVPEIVKVNSNLEVISGQHTINAARILGLGVYYAISEDRTPFDLITSETVTKWSDISALTTVAGSDKLSAKFLKFYLDVNKSLRKNKDYKAITISQLMAIVYKTPRYVYGLKANGGAYLLGTLKDFNPNDADTRKIIEIVSYAQKRCIKPGIKRYPFLIGLLDFIFKNNVDLDRLRVKMPHVRPDAGKSEDYYNHIKEVYS